MFTVCRISNQHVWTSSIYSNGIDCSKRKQTLEAPETISGPPTRNTGKTSNRENWWGWRRGEENIITAPEARRRGEQTNRIEVMFTGGRRTTNNMVIVSTSIQCCSVVVTREPHSLYSAILTDVCLQTTNSGGGGFQTNLINLNSQPDRRLCVLGVTRLDVRPHSSASIHNTQSFGLWFVLFIYLRHWHATVRILRWVRSERWLLFNKGRWHLVTI